MPLPGQINLSSAVARRLEQALASFAHNQQGDYFRSES